MVGLLMQSGLIRLADQMATVVYGWGLLKETGSSTAGGAVIAAGVASLVIGMLLAGRLISRFGARRVAFAGLGVSASVSVVIATLLQHGAVDPLTIAFLAALGAILDGPSAIASRLYYPQVARLARGDLLRMNSIDEGLEGASTLIAPAAGVILVSALGLAGGAWAIAVMSLIALILLLVSYPRFKSVKRRDQVPLSVIWTYLRHDQLLLRLTMLVGVLFAIVVTVQMIVLPRMLSVDPEAEGLLTTFLLTVGAASIVGAALSKPVARRLTIRAHAATSFGLMAAGLVAISVGSGMTSQLLGAVLMGVPGGLLAPVATSIFQARPPQALRADVQSVTGAIVLAMIPIPVAVCALLLETFSAKAVLLVLLAPALLATAIAAAGLSNGCSVSTVRYAKPSKDRSNDAM